MTRRTYPKRTENRLLYDCCRCGPGNPSGHCLTCRRRVGFHSTVIARALPVALVDATGLDRRSHEGATT